VCRADRGHAPGPDREIVECRGAWRHRWTPRSAVRDRPTGSWCCECGARCAALLHASRMTAPAAG